MNVVTGIIDDGERPFWAEFSEADGWAVCCTGATATIVLGRLTER